VGLLARSSQTQKSHTASLIEGHRQGTAGMTDRSKKGLSQLELRIGSGKPKAPERSLEVHCSNCGAEFLAYHGLDEENINFLHRGREGVRPVQRRSV